MLQLTWFFSSLYLITLYLTLFLRPLRGQSAELTSFTRSLPSRLNAWTASAYSPSFLTVLITLFVAIVTPNGFWGAYTPVEWLTPAYSLSYY